MDILLKGVGWADIALTLNRVAVGMFFMFSGYHKLFNAQRHRAFVDELTALHVAALRINQWWVPSVEFAARPSPPRSARFGRSRSLAPGCRVLTKILEREAKLPKWERRST